MKRRTLLSMLLLTLVTFLAIAARGIAQPVMCAGGTYTVDLTNVPAGCFQPTITVVSSWGGGAWVLSQSYTAPGVYVENPGAPAGAPLDFIKFGPATFAPGTPAQQTVNMNGCSLCVRACKDAFGCVVIKAYPGPCPAGPVPCP